MGSMYSETSMRRVDDTTSIKSGNTQIERMGTESETVVERMGTLEKSTD